MTREEIMRKYHISDEVLDEYEAINDLKNHEYTDEDLCPLSMIITLKKNLHDIL